jgi:hypothetical protein
MSVIKTRARLRIASYDDVFLGQKTLENKIFFLKCPVRHSFVGTYKLLGLDFHSYVYSSEEKRDLIFQRNDFIRSEIDMHLRNHSLYKLSDNSNGNDFQFMLYLRPALEHDLFYTASLQIPNVVCYVKLNENDIAGPLSLNDVLDVKNKFIKGQIYVPTTTQTFEPIKLSNAS